MDGISNRESHKDLFLYDSGSDLDTMQNWDQLEEEKIDDEAIENDSNESSSSGDFVPPPNMNPFAQVDLPKSESSKPLGFAGFKLNLGKVEGAHIITEEEKKLT